MELLFNNDKLILNDEPITPSETSKNVPMLANNQAYFWNIMIVDDEPEIHEVTHLALEDFVFEGKRLKFSSAYSGEEAKQLIKAQPNTALILLDVIMEKDDAGLQVIKYIRDVLKNKLVRIVLRTGQPDDVPEEVVILDYDINDYKAKTDLTWPKLFTTVVGALRSYRDLLSLEKHKQELTHVESVLRRYQQKLEETVEQRTVNLRDVNKKLQREIVERRQFERNLDAERNLLRALIDNLPDYIYVKDRASRFVMVNNAVVRVTGATVEADLMGKTDFDFYPIELAQKYFADEQAIMQSGKSLISQEEPLINQRTGNLEWLLITKIPIRDDEGNITGLVGLSRDITKRKQESQELSKYRDKLESLVTERTTDLMLANEQLRQEFADRKQADENLAKERNLLRILIDNVPDHIYVKDSQSRFLIANRAVARFMNMAMIEEMVGKTDFDLYEAELAKQLFEEEQKIIESGNPIINVEMAYLDRCTGKNVLLLTTKIPFQDSHGKIAGLVGIKRDITEQKQAEQERLQLLAMKSELAIAQRIQESLLLPPVPDWDGIEVICHTMPALEVGGDFYAYRLFFQGIKGWEQEGGGTPKYAIAVGDVSGKGMPAALLMAVSLASFQSVIAQEFSPGDLLAFLDKTILHYTKSTHQNCAMVYVEITPPLPFPESGITPTLPSPSKGEGSTPKKLRGDGLLRVANAGCVTPLIKRIDGSVEWVDVGGMPLGVGLGAKTGYQEVSLPLAKGDMIILTTDGVVEANNSEKEMFGFERLEKTVRVGPLSSATDMMAHLQFEVVNFMGAAVLHDDLTIVVIQV